MNWLYYILLGIGAVAWISQACVDYLVKYIFKDGRTDEHKKFRRILLGLSIALVGLNVATTWYLSVQRDQKAAKEKQDSDIQISILKSNQNSLTQTIEILNRTLSTNKAVDLT